ncbi:cytidine deaminase [Geothrix limicola]|uniref:Cytidine deaminase n=1 Tax=Geothrix limicola TaxID=2927978 RepID=A0ABQ5QFE2_9BACT|nr:cytidine deaminase [Geothrix limicola]GLH73555.1 cytidine deaminase [Geothrix limicola]
MFDDPQSPAWTPLLEAAWTARSHAHAPYSHFQVGAALLTAEGAVFGGCNVENAAYPVCLCAERGALSAAVAAGLRPGGLVAAVVVTDVAELTPPCGACRQALIEFAGELPVLLANHHGRQLHRLENLLPHSFTGSHFQ